MIKKREEKKSPAEIVLNVEKIDTADIKPNEEMRTLRFPFKKTPILVRDHSIIL